MGAGELSDCTEERLSQEIRLHETGYQQRDHWSKTLTSAWRSKGGWRIRGKERISSLFWTFDDWEAAFEYFVWIFFESQKGSPELSVNKVDIEMRAASWTHNATETRDGRCGEMMRRWAGRTRRMVGRPNREKIWNRTYFWAGRPTETRSNVHESTRIAPITQGQRALLKFER